MVADDEVDTPAIALDYTLWSGMPYTQSKVVPFVSSNSYTDAK